MADFGFSSPDRSFSGNNPRPQNWRIGDRVLAPWEPTFLYAGTLQEISGPNALIQFDDGDSGWVALARVLPLALRAGQPVMSRRRMGPRFFPGEIREIHGEDVVIDFEDGKEEETTVASLRIPCEPAGPGAEPVAVTSHRAFHDRLVVGDRVWALWKEAALFPGTVAERHEDEVRVEFDDGDEEWVPLEHLSPLDIIVGMFVLGRYRMGKQFYAGTIIDSEGDRIRVRYDDGDEEWTTAAALALPVQTGPPPRSAPPAAPFSTALQHSTVTHPLPPPTPAFSNPGFPSPASPDFGGSPVGWNPTMVLVIGSTLLIVVAGFFYWLGSR